MIFKSKAHMAQELLDGKKFRHKPSDSIVFYDEDVPDPFVWMDKNSGCRDVDNGWKDWCNDVWEEITMEKLPKCSCYYSARKPKPYAPCLDPSKFNSNRISEIYGAWDCEI